MPKWTKKADIERILRVARRLKWRPPRYDVPDKQIIPESYLDRNCPVCNSADKTYHGVRKIKSPTPKGWYVFQHHDVKCVACDFRYSTNIAEPAYIEDYYRHSIAYAGADYDACNRIKVIKRLVPKGSRVLEYGSGRGEFADLLRKEGYSVKAADVDDEISEKNYEAIFCYYTLEHLVFPNDTLKMFRGLLIEKGVLIVEVPDYEKDLKASFHFQHLNHFTKRHLSRMLENNDFKPTETIDGHSRGFGFAIISTV